MASTILSDNGVSSGSAGLKSTADSTGVLALQTTTSGGTATTALTIDTSQNVGIGTTPSAWSGFPALQIKNGGIYGAGTTDFGLVQNGYFNSGWKYIASSIPAALYSQSSGVHAWNIAGSGTAGNAITFTQAMTLDASGNLLVGTTSARPNGLTADAQIVATTASATKFPIATSASLTAAQTAIVFTNPNGNVGSVQTSGSSTSYVTSSDYRLKENVQPMTGALAKVAALKPVTYTWKADGSAGQGFIAHELQAVVPDCVTGEKDAVETYTDEDGNEQTRPKYQGIDTSFLVATLTAAIQEQQALITAQAETINALTARVVALESK